MRGTRARPGRLHDREDRHLVRHRVPVLLPRQASPRGCAGAVRARRRGRGDVAQLRARPRRRARVGPRRSSTSSPPSTARRGSRRSRSTGRWPRRPPSWAWSSTGSRPATATPSTRTASSTSPPSRASPTPPTSGSCAPTSPTASRSATATCSCGSLTEIGLDEGVVRAMLESDDYGNHVRSDEATAKMLGIESVPFFVLDRKYGVSGAQPVEVFTQALETAWAHPARGARAGRRRRRLRGRLRRRWLRRASAAPEPSERCRSLPWSGGPPPDVRRRRPLSARVREICLALPGADEKVSHGRPSFFTTKVFVTYGGTVKGDHDPEPYRQSVLVLPDAGRPAGPARGRALLRARPTRPVRLGRARPARAAARRRRSTGRRSPSSSTRPTALTAPARLVRELDAG